MSAPRNVPPDVADLVVGLMGSEAAAEWWSARNGQWFGGFTPAELYATGKAADTRLVVDVLEAALVGAVPLEGH